MTGLLEVGDYCSFSYPSGFFMLLASKKRVVPGQYLLALTLQLKDDVETVAHTRITLPIKVVLWIAVTFQLQAQVLSCRAVRKGNVVVSDIVKEVNLILWQHNGSRDRVHRCITPAFVEEATVLVKSIEVVEVLLRAEPV